MGWGLWGGDEMGWTRGWEGDGGNGGLWGVEVGGDEGCGDGGVEEMGRGG